MEPDAHLPIQSTSGKDGPLCLVPHITENFIPFSEVLHVLVDAAYSDLSILIRTLPSSSDLEKKQRILDYLIQTRKDFIKLFVLFKWIKHSDECSRCIDAVAWLSGQRNCFLNVIHALRDVKQSLGAARLSKPDIQTALHVLQNGQPEFKVPPSSLLQPYFTTTKPLPPSEILSVLRQLNVLLALRLGLDENLIKPFQKYHIADGRAKFDVPGEFTVSVSVADENPQARFFMVDFDFAFSPRQLVSALSKRAIESSANQALSEQGLPGLYDCLSDFTQTYKLIVLYQQARQYAAEIERLGNRVIVAFRQDLRLLSIHYWVIRSDLPPGVPSSRPTGKSIVDISISSATNRLAVRWIREGLVANEFVPIDQTNLSITTLMKHITDLHSKWVFRTIASSYPEICMAQDECLCIEPIIPSDSSTSKIKLYIDRHSGRFYFKDNNYQSLRADNALNAQLDVTKLDQSIILGLRYSILKEQLRQRAIASRWSLRNITLRSEDVQTYLGLNSRQYLLFRQINWTPDWFVALAVKGDELSWSVVRISFIDGAWVIMNCYPLTVQGNVQNYNFWSQLVPHASLIIAKNILLIGFSARSIRYKLLRTMHYSTSIVVDTRSFLQQSIMSSALYLQISIKNDDSLVLDLVGRVQTNQLPTSEDLFGNLPGFKFSNGVYKMHFVLTIGANICKEVICSLCELERSCMFIRTLHLSDQNQESKPDFVITKPTLNISTPFGLEADESGMGKSKERHGQSKISFVQGSPLKLVEPLVQESINLQRSVQNSIGDDGSTVMDVVQTVKPLVMALESFFSTPGVYVIARDINKFRIFLKRAKAIIDISLRQRGEKFQYFIDTSCKDIQGIEPKPIGEEVVGKLQDGGIYSFGTSVACDLDKLGNVLDVIKSWI